ncbi:CHAT domain-containing protein [Mucilaginibacter angelicae]|uniref:CHAT domain-containing protein n=1 Tax=Mucilaginibacter angelicae TaxID=869718 RepID=A0ABV6L6Q7_9SPHI
MLYTGLLFAGASVTLNQTPPLTVDEKSEDGILTGFEAENLDLRQTALVVLSACETGQGDLIRNGEGTYSLQRAFRTAGAGAVLYSMWRVNDQVTQKLMTCFYRNWLKGENLHIALRHAQQDIRLTYPDPYYWGAFVLSAEP